MWRICYKLMSKITTFIHLLYFIIPNIFFFLFFMGIIFILPDQIILRLHMHDFLERYGHILGPLCWFATSVSAVILLKNSLMRHSKIKNEKKILKLLRTMNSECAAITYDLYENMPYHSMDIDYKKKGCLFFMESNEIIIKSGQDSYVLNPIVTKIIEQDYLLEHYLKVQYEHN